MIGWGPCLAFSDWPKLEAGQKLEKLAVAKQVLAIWGILLQQFREGDGTPLQYSCWKIPWTEEPGGLQSMGSLRVGHD